MPLLAMRTTGLTEWRAKIAAARLALAQQLFEAMTTTMLATAARLGAAAPVGAGQGRYGRGIDGDAAGPLFESFEGEVAGAPTAPVAEGRVYTTQPTKLKYVRYGTGIFGPTGQRIYPRQASALSWIDPMTGLRITRKSVAGMPPRDFVTPVINEAKVEAEIAVREAVAEAKAFLRG